MKTKLVAAFAIAIGLLAVSAPLLAHHGTAAYDYSKAFSLKADLPSASTS